MHREKERGRHAEGAKKKKAKGVSASKENPPSRYEQIVIRDSGRKEKKSC